MSIVYKSMFQIRRLILVPSLLRSLLMYLEMRVSIQSYIVIYRFDKIGKHIIIT